MADMDTRPLFSARLPLAVGWIALVLLLGGVGVWSVGVRIAGAIVAPGIVKVETDRQVIQHPDGGVVGEILAFDGDVVEAGDLLVRFDDTFLRSELNIVERQLFEILMRKARLEAERDQKESVEFPEADEFASLNADWMQDQLQGQRNLFDARRTSLEKSVEQLSEQQEQVESQIDGTVAQQMAITRQLDLVRKELDDQTALRRQGLAQASTVSELEREAARLQGEVGRLAAAIAEARGRISGQEIEIVRLHDQRREEAITQLRDLGYVEIEQAERRLSLLEQLSRMEVRAPVGGAIFGSRVMAVNAVVRPADPMMFIIPADAALQISARVDPVSIDEVHAGQQVSLKFNSFNQRTTPDIPGEIVRVSADTLRDEQSGAVYYEAVISPDMQALADLSLLPGMPVTVFMKTGERTLLSYLTQPLTTYFTRAFRED